MNNETSPGPPPDPTRTRETRRSPRGLPESFPFLLPPVQDDEIGRLGKYRVLRLLGAGGMGMVFKAENIALRRAVALKVMKPEEERKGEHSGQRFLREARAMAAIKHDNLVTIYDIDREGETIFIAMELLEGMSLDHWIARAEADDIAEIVRISREIAVGLSAIHKSGLVHRDLKPTNLWLEAPDGRVKILDFGLARETGGDAQLTETGILVGTPAFLSPEQARGKRADFRSDLFSLGCVLYRMCTKELPFRGENTLDQLAALAADRPTPVPDLNPRVPGALSDLIMELLAKAPEDRPASAQEVAERLLEIKRSLTRRRKATARSRQRQTVRTEVIDNQEQSPWWQSTAAKIGLMIAIFATLLIAVILVVVAVNKQDSLNANGGAGQKEFLSEMPKLATMNWPFHQRKKGKGPKPPPPPKEIFDGVSVQGKPSPHGIFMHAAPQPEGPASISYRLDKQFRTFSCRVSMNDSSPGSPSPLTFAVYGDGALLWNSRGVSTQADVQECSISVAGVDVLKLEVTTAGDVKGAHAVWLEPMVEK